MLREIESWLEFLLQSIKKLDPDKVARAEKIKEAERRDRVRRAKKEEQQVGGVVVIRCWRVCVCHSFVRMLLSNISHVPFLFFVLTHTSSVFTKSA
jgi:hypothetical protein